MIRITAHTRRGPAVTCDCCRDTIEPGERYRLLIAVREDVFADSFVRHVAHEVCAADSSFWTLTTPTELHRRAVDSLAFVRERYGLDVRPGQRCVAIGKPGEVTGGDGKYVRVRLDGQRHAANYHARDLVLEAP